MAGSIAHMEAAAQLPVAAQLHIYALVQAQAYQVEGLFHSGCVVLGHPAGAGRQAVTVRVFR